MRSIRLVSFFAGSIFFGGNFALPGLIIAGEPDLPSDLSKVAGLEHFPADVGLRERLSRDGFVAVPRFHRQIFSPYLEPVPAFITPESVIRTYQVILEAGIARLEEVQATRLKNALRRVLVGVKAFDVKRTDWAQARTTLHAWAFVAWRLMEPNARPDLEVSRGEDPLSAPDGVRILATAELELARRGLTESSRIFQRPFPYGHLKATGLYTKSQRLEHYFEATRWLGQTGFRIDELAEARCALLLAIVVNRDPELSDALGKLEATWTRLLGPEDDSSALSGSGAIARLLAGKPVPTDDSGLDAILPRFVKEIENMPAPGVLDEVTTDDLVPRVPVRNLRLLPPRRTPAEEALSIAHREHRAAGPGEILRSLSVTPAESIHAEACQALSLLLESPPSAAPPFAHTKDWKDHCDWAALGSWVLLSHPWQLHGKSFVVILGEGELPPESYVAPYPELFERIGSVADSTAGLLRRQGTFNPEPNRPDGEADGGPIPDGTKVRDAFEKLATLCRRLAVISRLQLAGKVLDEADRTLLRGYGLTLARLHFYEGQSYTAPRDDLPMASLYTTVIQPDLGMLDRYLAVGRAMEVFVIRNGGRGLQLYRGATFSLYEMEQRDAARLTDEAWRAVLDATPLNVNQPLQIKKGSVPF